MVEVPNAGVRQASFVDKCHSQRQISSRRWLCLATNIGDLPIPAFHVNLNVQLNWSHNIDVPLSVGERVFVGHKYIL